MDHELDDQTSPPLLKSGFLELPPEIRFQIYSHLFKGQTVTANAYHYPQNDGEPPGHISLQPPTQLLNVFYTCRLIYSEAITVFYNLIRFRFERHSIDEITWSLAQVHASFPSYRPIGSTDKSLASTRHLVRHIFYAGNDHAFIRDVGKIFPNLKLFEFCLSWDHLGNDQINFDRAMKYAIRNREWRHAVKDALEQRFPDGMVRAVWELQKSSSTPRGFKVLLHWRLGYRFIEFLGECDLDEWILHVRDPEGASKNVYDIRQDPLFFEMG
ncbi:hypothetical protein PMZ80_010690 [Knufia obscura]|uniref:Uncharacterized protein n=2 Tax=Knufia TaxID=430999 RepID=A0AAN8EWR9_9EURO|nr:hypothetical protein PMZ80_010690 [Knufia obscura]KAK5955381.1 hypothetical protein OHC33_004064 [Knufia fluminis]